MCCQQLAFQSHEPNESGSLALRMVSQADVAMSGYKTVTVVFIISWNGPEWNF